MKIWVKYVAGIVAGLLLGAFIPAIPSTTGFFSACFGFIVSLGQYAFFPMVFFSATVAIHELSLEEKVLKVFLRSLLTMTAVTALFILIGILGFFLFSYNGLSPILDQTLETAPNTLPALASKLFPANAFEVFTSAFLSIQNGNLIVGPAFLLPLFIMAFFIGTNSTFDRMTTKPAISLFESLNSVFYHINTFIVELMGFGMIFITTHFVLQIKSAERIGYFSPLILSLSAAAILIVFAALPALMFWRSRQSASFMWLYGIIAPAVAGFFSGNNFFSSATLVEHGRQNLGVKRKVGAFVFPFYSMFGRAGSAMVTAVAFLTVLKSYSPSLSLLTVLWVFVFSLLISFALPAVPAGGVIVALGLLSNLYGGVMERFAILKPSYIILIGFAVLLDIVSSAFCSILVATKTDEKERVLMRDFV
jgi:Na+/H+-dicarboxylate symporter